MAINDKAAEIINKHIASKNVKCGACGKNEFQLFPTLHFFMQVEELPNRPDLNMSDLNNIKGMAVISVECKNCFAITQFSPRILGITPDMLKI